MNQVDRELRDQMIGKKNDRYADWYGAGKLHYTEMATESQRIAFFLAIYLRMYVIRGGCD